MTSRAFAQSGTPTSARLAWFVNGLRAVMIDEGYVEQPVSARDAAVVLHLVDPAQARPYRRKSAPTFVLAIAELPQHEEQYEDPQPEDQQTEDRGPIDRLRFGYPLLVRALANLAVLVTNDGAPAAQFVTLEQGVYSVTHTGDDDKFFRMAFERIEPLASSRLVIANEFRADLPPALWWGDEQTRQIARAGKRLSELDLLPAPFPIEEILTARDLRHVKLLYGIGGLSYGNLSSRRQPSTQSANQPGFGPEFWMSASGVDKSKLETVGRDVLLVHGYDETNDTMVLSVPPDVTPNRVSVDAIEHWMIYHDHPDIGAILHVHAWIDGTEATEINYPCGTLQLAVAVAELVRRSPDPSRAIVGQRNHGLTITGPSLDEIFERIDGKIVRTVPMG